MKNFYSTNTPGGAPMRTWKAPTRVTPRWLAALWVMLLLPWAGTAYGQTVASYGVVASTGTYTPITGGTVLGTTGLDDNAYTITIPSFTFNGTAYTTAYLSANGNVSFGAAQSSYTPLSSTGGTGVIAAYGADLGSSTATGATPEIRWQTVGTETIFQFTDIPSYYQRTLSRVSYQIRLNSSNGNIVIIYGGTINNTYATAYTAQVGLRGATTADYNNRTGTWAASTAGGANTASLSISSTSMPAAGLTFTYTPPAPCTGTPTGGTLSPTVIAGCAGSGAGQVISVTGSTTGVSGLTYQWEESPDGVSNWTNAPSGTGATFTTLAYATIKYYRRRTTCTPSGLSDVTSNLSYFGPAAPTVQTTALTFSPSTVAGTINFTVGNGAASGGGRIVKINTTNTFTDPIDGDNPAASTVYAGGEQTVLNATGTTATVTVTGLTAGTTYYVRVYEFSCNTSRKYITSTATGNPGNFTTLSKLDYVVTRSTGVGFSSITSPTALGTAVPFAGTGTDDQISNAVTLPFTFMYQGQPCTTIKVNTNGWASLLSTETSTTYVNNLGSTSSPFAVLAPFWDDQTVANNPTTTAALNANIRYNITGSAGNRIFLVEWGQQRTFNNYAGPLFQYQLLLYENGNKIEFRYGQMQAYSFSPTKDQAFDYSIGLKGFSVSATPQAGELMAQQYENTTAFDYRGAGVANYGANGLRIAPECNSSLLFTPGTYPGFTPPNLGVVPSNDNITSALQVTAEPTIPSSLCGSAYNATFNYTSRNASLSSTAGAASNGGQTGALADDDVWFQFDAIAPQTTLRVSGSGGYRAVMQLGTFDGTTFTQLANASVAATAQGLATSLTTGIGGIPLLTTGLTYYVRIFHFGGGNGATASISSVDGNGGITGVTLGSGGTGYITSLDANSTTVYPLVRISGATGRGGYIRPTSVSSGVISGYTIVQAGQGYSVGDAITVDPPGAGSSGAFAFVVNATPVPPANDECTGAIQLSTPTTYTPLTNQSTFTALASSEATCNGTVTSLQDVWYVFQSPYQGGTVTVTPSSGSSFDPLVQVFSLGTAANVTAARALCGSKTVLSPAICQNNNGSGTAESVLLTGLNPNDWYAVRVYNAGGGSGGNGNFEIGFFATDIYPPLVTVTSYTPGACTAGSHTVNVSIVDGSGVATGANGPKLTYNVDGGSDVIIPLTFVSGTNWTATIPAQGSGQVVFTITAQDLAATPNSATTSGGAYQDAYLQIDAGADKTVNEGTTTILKATDLSVANTIKITEFILYDFGTGIQTTFPSYVTSTDDNIEISNVGNTSVDISSFTLYVVGASTASFTFPAGTTLNQGQVAIVHIGAGTDNPSNLYFNTVTGTGPSSGSAIGYYLKSNSGRVIDAVAVNSYTFPAALGIGTQWTGAGVSSPSGIAGAKLKTTDLNNSTNWATSSASELTSEGYYNSTLTPVAASTITWSGGNLSGPVAGAQITTPTFVATGTPTPYTFTASITDGTCTTSDQIIVTSQPPVTPTANFIATPTSGTTGGVTTTFVFTDQSTNAPDTWAWSFTGPGTATYVSSTNSTSQNPQVTFSAAGTYTAVLTVTNGAGTNTKTRTNYITVTNQYCLPTVSTPAADEDIGRVQIGGTGYGSATPTNSNPAATGGYTDYTGLPGFTVQKTVSQSIAVSVINSGVSYYTTNVNVYIDYNQNGVFETSELVIYGELAATATTRTLSGNITVPFSAMTGVTRMRVIADEVSGGPLIIAPCATFTWGEVEDYKINLTAPPACTTPPNAGSVTSSTPSGCGTPATFTGMTTGSVGGLQWQIENSTTNPNVWNNVAGANATTQNISIPTVNNYRLRLVASNPGCAEAISAPLTFNVNALPAAPTAGSATPSTFATCSPATSVTFSATPATGATVRWYTASTGGAPIATGNTYTTSVSVTTTFYAESYNSTTGCGSTRTAVTVTNTANIGAPTASNQTRCGAGTIDLTATTTGNTIRWYAAATGGSPIYTGSPYTTPYLNGTATYYVEGYSSTTQCVSTARTQVIATVDNNIPQIPTATGASRCGPGTVNLAASGANVRWFDAPTGGTQVFDGANFTTPSLTSPTTYYAEASALSVATLPSPTRSGTSGDNFGGYLVFSVLKPTIIYSVAVYPTVAGTYGLTIYDNSNAAVYVSPSFTATAGQVGTKVIVPLNVSLPVGTGYQMAWNGSDDGYTASLGYQFSAVFPYAGQSLSITGADIGTIYEYFYEWKYRELGCPSTARTAALANVKPLGTWAGTTSDWGTGSNWCGGAVPTTTSDVLIETGGAIVPPVISAPATARNLSLVTGATVTLNSTLGVTGNISGQGAGPHIINGTGTITLNGTATQNLNGSMALPNVTVSNASTVTAGSRVRINAGSRLQVNALFTVDPASDLILRSTSAGTASLGPVGTPSNFVGQLTMERYVYNAGWHFIGAPIQSVDFGQWSESAQRIAPKNNATLFRYTENDITIGVYNLDTTERNGWKVVPSLTDGINPLQDIRGYRAYIRASFMTQGSHAGYLDVKGTPFIGTASSSYTKTPGGWEGGGYNLIANPYPSAISWTAVTASNGGSGGTHGGSIYEWNSVQSNYGQYVAGAPSGTNGTSDVIPSSQGFFIKATAAGTLTYAESHKVAGSGSFLRNGSEDPYMKVRVTNASGFYDESMLWLNPESTPGYDAGRDAYEMSGEHINMSFLPVSGLNLAINCQPEPTERRVIPMRFTTRTQGEFTVSFENVASLTTTGARLYLHDNFTGAYHDMSTGDYAASVTSNPLSQGDTRFELVYEPTAVTGIHSTVATAQLSAYPNPTAGADVLVAVNGLQGSKAALSLTDALGRVVYTSTLNLDKGQGTEKVKVGGLSAGMYTLTVQSSGNSLRQQIVVK